MLGLSHFDCYFPIPSTKVSLKKLDLYWTTMCRYIGPNGIAPDLVIGEDTDLIDSIETSLDVTTVVQKPITDFLIRSH